jgi:uroporphyrin-III C-methyltransferase/precorrin-2 dehydrogenase/sirohydrochlorin ferrochelatase
MSELFVRVPSVRVDPGTGPWVALVGAGPGDPDLLTRRAATLLGAADVVLHDWLSGAAVLALARPDALLVDVGKGKGCGTDQRRIEQLIVAHHDAGARVVRLKGGDPFVFGRGMEEVRAAEDAGIVVEVVPGVSSAIAAPGLGGIAVTERHVSAQVTVVSGHRVDGANDWAHLARLDGTLVVLMAATTAPRIGATLIDCGAPADRPVAVVADASGAGQAVWHTTLAGLAAHAAPLPGPCVVVVGEVARARVAVGDHDAQLVELLRRDAIGAGAGVS